MAEPRTNAQPNRVARSIPLDGAFCPLTTRSLAMTRRARALALLEGHMAGTRISVRMSITRRFTATRVTWTVTSFEPRTSRRRTNRARARNANRRDRSRPRARRRTDSHRRPVASKGDDVGVSRIDRWILDSHARASRETFGTWKLYGLYDGSRGSRVSRWYCLAAIRPRRLMATNRAPREVARKPTPP